MTKAGYKKHKAVIDWFYEQPDTTCVLVRNKDTNQWLGTNCPTFSENDDYLINDEYSEIRKAIYEGKEIEMLGGSTGSWTSVKYDDPNTKFTCIREALRVNPKLKSPVIKKDKNMIVKFTSEHTFTIVFVFNTIGFNFMGITDFSDVIGKEFDYNINDERWEDVLYDEEKDLWDGQPIWCFNDAKSVTRELKFYDAKFKCTFNDDGDRHGCMIMLDNYLPYEHLSDEWVINSYNRLKF